MSNDLLSQLRLAIQDVDRAVENVEKAKEIVFQSDELRKFGALEQIQSVLELLSKDLFSVKDMNE